MNRYIIDRFEEETAVLEGADGCIYIDGRLLDGMREGDSVLWLTDGNFVKDEAATSARSQALKERMQRLRIREG